LNVTQAHIVTLWCAILSKADRGFASVLPRDVPIQQFRLLSLLSRVHPGCMSAVRLAHALTMRPSDVDDALASLFGVGLVDHCESADGEGASWRVTPLGIERTRAIDADVALYHASCLALLDDDDRRILSALFGKMLRIPGSFYARKDYSAHIKPLGTFGSLSVIATLHRVVSSAIRHSCRLSLTDFRFLLELYPKRGFGNKTLRARDMVAFLRTGRAYVTTASVRLEEQGLIERIPDEHDARGILFILTPAGYYVVQTAGDDVFAVLASMFGSVLEERRIVSVLKRLLRGEDSALASLKGK